MVPPDLIGKAFHFEMVELDALTRIAPRKDALRGRSNGCSNHRYRAWVDSLEGCNQQPASSDPVGTIRPERCQTYL